MKHLRKLTLYPITACIVCLLSACEGNIDISSESSSRSEKSIKSESRTIINGDTSYTESSSQEKNVSEEQKNTNIGFNVKDKTGIADQVEKKLRRENNDTTPRQNKDKNTPASDKPNTSSAKLKKNVQCVNALGDDDFETLKQELADISLDKDRLAKSKSLFNDQCLSSAQARDLAMMFKLENYKLDFVKFAYGRTVDKNNFLSKFKNVFSFSDSRNKLAEYIGD